MHSALDSLAGNLEVKPVKVACSGLPPYQWTPILILGTYFRFDNERGLRQLPDRQASDRVHYHTAASRAT